MSRAYPATETVNSSLVIPSEQRPEGLERVEESVRLASLVQDKPMEWTRTRLRSVSADPSTRSLRSLGRDDNGKWHP